MVPPHCAKKLTNAMLLMWDGSFRCIVWRNQEPLSNLPPRKYSLPSLSGQGKLRVTQSYTGDEEVVVNWKATDSTKACQETDIDEQKYLFCCWVWWSHLPFPIHTRDINNPSSNWFLQSTPENMLPNLDFVYLDRFFLAFGGIKRPVQFPGRERLLAEYSRRGKKG